MSAKDHGVLAFPCPKCDESLEVSLHVVTIAVKPTRKSPKTGTTYGHPVAFIAEAPNLHAHFWGHMVRCHQPDPHPYMGGSDPSLTVEPVLSETP